MGSITVTSSRTAAAGAAPTCLPPGGGPPEDTDLGLRPADLAWSGFPLLWRRGIEDQSFPLDLLLGRPVLVFAHLRELGHNFLPLVERAVAVARLTGTSSASRAV